MTSTADEGWVNAGPTDGLWIELERLLSGRITSLRRRPSEYRTSFAVEELDVDLAEGPPLALVLKCGGPESLSAEARRVRPSFLYEPLREIEAYREILVPERVTTPAFYGAVVGDSTGRQWLFLERVRGHELWREGDFSIWEEAARWLARVHGRLSTVSADKARRARLLRYDSGLLSRWPARAAALGRLDGALAALPARYGEIVERLASLPRTVIHGEFYASNVMVREAGREICPLDWELAGWGPGLIDLAALASGAWSDEQRHSLALAYHAELAPASRPPLGDMLVSLDCCRLHLAVQWLGWARDWSPPPEHAQDWRAEATALSARLLP